MKSELLHDSIRKKITATIDTGYTDEYGIRELVDRAGEVLADLDIVKEKALMQRFMTELVAGKGLVAYGERDVRERLGRGAVELLLISEPLRRIRVATRCQTCGHEFQETVEEVETYKKQLATKSCPKCGEEKLVLIESKDLVQELIELADKFGARVEFVSAETDEGKQLLIAFKGLAAILRFRPA